MNLCCLSLFGVKFIAFYKNSFGVEITIIVIIIVIIIAMKIQFHDSRVATFHNLKLLTRISGSNSKSQAANYVHPDQSEHSAKQSVE